MTSTVDKTKIEYLKDTFKIGYDAYKNSRDEAQIVWDLFHNRQYTEDQLNILEIRGQPAETFNVVKLFARLLVGYYSTIINKIQTNPMGPEDVPTSNLLNDVIDYCLRINNFEEEGERIKLCGLITGMMAVYEEVRPTGEVDRFNRPINQCYLEYIPQSEIIIDPMARRVDRTDARWIHRYKWLSEEAVELTFGKSIMKKMTEYYNFTDTPDAEFEESYFSEFNGLYRLHNNYLVVHSVVEDLDGKRWSIFWHDEIIIEKKEITFKKVKFPYRIVLLHDSDDSEYYGIFREVIESQKAINQALIKLQLLINSQRAFVEANAVENIADFTNAFNRVTGVVPTLNNRGIKIETASREVQEQYIIINKAFDRIQRLLGINDSFLGTAFASDSGRKVKLQQNATIMSLRYFTVKLEAFYRLLGWDIAHLIQQYYTAEQVIRIADNFTGDRWALLNQPETIWSGEMDAQGQPIMEYGYEEVLDPSTNEPMINEDGNYIIAPIPKSETEIAFSKIDIEIVSTSYNDEDEKNQLMLETILNGNVGQMLSQVNPAGFFKAAGLSMMSLKIKNAPEIAKIYSETATMLGGNPQAQQEASFMAQGNPGQSGQAKSAELKLPQNTRDY